MCRHVGDSELSTPKSSMFTAKMSCIDSEIHNFPRVSLPTQLTNDKFENRQIASIYKSIPNFKFLQKNYKKKLDKYLSSVLDSEYIPNLKSEVDSDIKGP